MDNGARFGALLPKSVYMGHYIMAHFFFPLFSNLIINFVLMRLHFVNLLLGNGQTQLVFRFCQSNPKFSPGSKFHIRGE